MSLTIEAGKFYRTKNGNKVRVYAIYGVEDDKEKQPIHGAWLCGKGWFAAAWCKDGSWPYEHEDGFNLVAPWVDPPVVDWEKFPKHIVAIAMGASGKWYGYLKVPIIGITAYTTHNPYEAFDIRDTEYEDITFSGDWRDSLVIRPGYDEAKP